MANRPAASTTHSPPIPARSAPKRSTKVKNIQGARNDAARPVVVYRPNATPSLPGPDSRSINARAAARIGPTNRHSASPQIQNSSGPEPLSNTSPTAIMAASEQVMTGLGPTRSASTPPDTAPTAATMLTHTPKISTSACDTPYTLTPSTAPNAKIPVSPSRNTALATSEERR